MEGAMDINEESEGGIDRRTARTRAALKRALVSLILAKGYEAITVSELCLVAGISRSTFYAHFTSKDDIKRSGLQQLRRALQQARSQVPADGEPNSPDLDFARALFEHARDHRDLYLALSGGPGAAVALETIRAIIAERVRHELVRTDLRGAQAREVVVQFVAGAYLAVLTWWLDAGAKAQPAEVADACRSLALFGISRPPIDPCEWA